MQTIKETSEQIANSFMPFILIGIEQNDTAIAEVRQGMAKDIERAIAGAVTQEAERLKAEIQFAIDTLRLVHKVQSQGCKIDAQEVIRRFEKAIQEG
jgi:ribosomal protein S17E